MDPLLRMHWILYLPLLYLQRLDWLGSTWLHLRPVHWVININGAELYWIFLVDLDFYQFNLELSMICATFDRFLLADDIFVLLPSFSIALSFMRLVTRLPVREPSITRLFLVHYDPTEGHLGWWHVSKDRFKLNEGESDLELISDLASEPV